MKTRQIKALASAMTIIALFAGAACKKGAGSSPTATFKAYVEAVQHKDTAAVKKTFSKGSLEFFEKAAKAQNKTVDEMLKTGLTEEVASASMPEIRNEKIEGDSATLEVKDIKSGKWETVPFVKEDGEWKIALEKMGAQTPAG
jgi:hypothetical protein